ncbi:hypothetical protein AFLA_006340 [Aspergillus flavus NRRL3357]|nr:hypothetical protein AFLA_006340 [Aspergillus flavus NRRL3357]
MGSIYAHSLVTIAQLIGDGAHDGLWATRGWSFQEAMLSSQRLFFSDQGATFEDDSTREPQMEDLILHELHYAPVNLSWFGLVGYGTMVDTFTQRELSFDSDILSVLIGILELLFSGRHYSVFDWRVLEKCSSRRHAMRHAMTTIPPASQHKGILLPFLVQMAKVIS